MLRQAGVTVNSEMMMTGRLVHAERVLAIGRVNQAVAVEELEAAAYVFVSEIMATSPMGLRMTR